MSVQSERSPNPPIVQDTTESMIDAIRDTRTRADKAKVNGKQVTFVYGYTYALWEQYLEIKDLLYTICGYTLLGIALATLACQMSPESSFFICLSILIINIECYGAMSLLGLKLNAFSVVNLCISVGLAVEFTAHFSRAFLVASGDGNMRMRAAFAEVGSPMFCGALSTFLSISWFAASNLKFIRIYCKSSPSAALDLSQLTCPVTQISIFSQPSHSLPSGMEHFFSQWFSHSSDPNS